MTPLSIVSAGPDDLGRYLEFLEEVANWLETRGIQQWPPGNFRRSAEYYADSIAREEVQLAFLGNESFLDANRSSSPFRRVWVYDCGTEAVRFSWKYVEASQLNGA